MIQQLENFDANSKIDEIIKWIQDWFNENGPKASAVVGVSGGKDSTIVAALLVRALGKERVVGVLMPNGEQKDIEDSKKVVELLGIKNYIVNINAAVEGLYGAIEKAVKENPDDTGLFVKELTKDSKINTPPRMRMATLYAIAQSLPNGGRVANTCNKSEDYVGYSTKYGDAAGDFSPCSDFTVTEMRLIGDALGLPKELIHKTPSDGLSGMSDEDKLGFTYDELDRYIFTGECEDAEKKAKIDRLHNINLHKLRTIPMFEQQ
ncbi:NAD(+) synthase [Butyrivibrio sp. YAB3001]|uniref:NAD(+) synthase n=1 Tax=Butyrivibrio sp. YAB3001 TaxID=1520812 RepID=UPI0008F6815C|nr:NAD(+) synthase [Butyrivibrio sp. YAB3001]SFB83773.1 NAD+ synthase [Butyrivibrio sp. YAB3001]